MIYNNHYTKYHSKRKDTIFMDMMNSLFEKALNLEPPWTIKKVEFDTDQEFLPLLLISPEEAYFPVRNADNHQRHTILQRKSGDTSTFSSIPVTLPPERQGSNARSTVSLRPMCHGHDPELILPFFLNPLP